MRGTRLFLTLFILPFCLLLIPSRPAYATEISDQEGSYEAMEEEEEDVEAESSIGKKWKDIIDMAKDFFIGPAYDEKTHIDGIKDIDPYKQLGGINFSGGEGMNEAKGVSASYYKLIYTISVIGLLLSFIAGGIGIAWSRSRNKSEVEAALAVKILAFLAVVGLTGLWGILLPILKMLSDAG